jgi:DNA-binding FadR family transcriptional regulator
MAIDYGTLVTAGVAKQIAESLREAIIRGDLKVDERLPSEHELAARFGVSRPTIREALNRLAAQNLIRSRRGPAGGSFVNRVSHEEIAAMLESMASFLVSIGEFDLAEITEARQELEILCCRLAAERHDEADLAAMAAELATQRDRSISDVEFCASDVRFHRLIVLATKNRALHFAMLAVVGALQPAANMVIYRFRERQRIIKHHERLFAEIQQRRPDAAAAALRELMAYLREMYAQAQDWRRERDAPVAGAGRNVVA